MVGFSSFFCFLGVWFLEVVEYVFERGFFRRFNYKIGCCGFFEGCFEIG